MLISGVPANVPDHLEFLYGARRAADLARRITSLADAYRERIPAALRSSEPRTPTQRDAILITYADQVRAPGEVPLRTLHSFLNRHAAGVVSAVHVLPFYPWTSDDGFAITDYLAVEPEYGTWDDIIQLGSSFELMVDAVFNHLSAESAWFQRFLADDPGFEDFFVTVEGAPDLSRVVRPRALPLLTEFVSASGPRKVWTTFSSDQVDLNVRNPEVLLALLEVLLFYVSCGARFIRLDAIAYLWKEIGTPCIHLPQTHRIIRLMRAVLDDVAPRVLLITETNVPHADNISYFGEDGNEAQLVYNFTLPPLTVHSFRTGDARTLSRWASGLKTPTPEVCFFNFLASHDGIGLNPARDVLSGTEVADLVSGTLELGGLISYKSNPDGSSSPYEMNISFIDALAAPGDGIVDDEVIARRALCAHAIMLSLPGVPGIYFHSLFGSRGDPAGAEDSGIPRRINREKLTVERLEAELGHPRSLRHHVFSGMSALLRVRREDAAFLPSAPAAVLAMDPHVFAIRRGPAGDGVLCLHNVSRRTVDLHGSHEGARVLHSLGATLAPGGVRLDPFGFIWLRAAAR